MLNDFLVENRNAVLSLTEQKTRELASDHPSSEQLERGLPAFYDQIVQVIAKAGSPQTPPKRDVGAIARAADRGDEPAMAEAASQPLEAAIARTAGLHGLEMLRLGYTLSHVVHAYGALCQAVTEVATAQEMTVEAVDFHALNRCLDVAIAGAVTSYHPQSVADDMSRKGHPAQVSAQDVRNLLMRAKVAFQAIRSGTVGLAGVTADSLEGNLSRLEGLLEQLLADRDRTRPPS